jgi:hypothetical protein
MFNLILSITCKKQRNILHEISKWKANWIGHILCRNCLLMQVIEGKIKQGIEVAGRWGRRCRKLLDDLKERRGYCHLKEALDRTMWRAGFGRGFGPVVRQTAKWICTVVPFIFNHHQPSCYRPKNLINNKLKLFGSILLCIDKIYVSVNAV